MLTGKRWDAGKYDVELQTEDRTSKVRVSVAAPGTKAARCPRAVGGDGGPMLVVSCREGESVPSGMVVVPSLRGDRPTSLVVRVTKDGAAFGFGKVTLPWIESRECQPVCVWAHTTLTL